MFLGHYGLALAAKKIAPKVSLTMLFVAVEFVDILWPFLLIFNIETVKVHPGFTEVTPFEFVHYPYTHSLFMGIVWGLIVGGCFWLFKKDTKSAVIVGLAVLSHWFLDVIVHIPDLPLTPFGDFKVGMGLWNYKMITILLESIIFFGGVYIYAKSTKAINAQGTWGLWIMTGFFLLANAYNLFGPPPEDNVMVLFVSFVVLQVIVLGLAWWVDKNRVMVGESV
ncbi:metal-dependent hydrolase [Dyadobacter sp. CY356]|uniref:metal-dependent hydrolase n=1 Tax=Dyadobacter sp. CY356 TaxID=2906442 RepID=UPI001F2B077A|nr:metal-dependent hydrolase [Dyadobacter sp. CY356]MCF0056848.1 hypothetical protein [Dyadobacter sp. CY356]